MCNNTHKTLYNLALNNKLHSTILLQLSPHRIPCVPDFSVCISHKVHSLGIKCSEPPAQFNGIYKISQVFGSVSKLNEPPAQFLLSGNMTTFQGFLFLQQLKRDMLVLPLVNQPSTTTHSSQWVSEQSFNHILWIGVSPFNYLNKINIQLQSSLTEIGHKSFTIIFNIMFSQINKNIYFSVVCGL